MRLTSSGILTVLAVLLLVVSVSIGSALVYAQSTNTNIPLLGKLQKGFHDPNTGLIDAWHVDYDTALTPPAGARTTNTVYSHLASLSARGGTVVSVGGTSDVPPNPGVDEIFLFDQPGTITAIPYNSIVLSSLQTQRGDLFQSNGTNWVKVTGFDAIPDDTVIEAMLKIQGNPAAGECVGWDGTEMEWVGCATGGGSVTITPGSITQNELADKSVTEPKLDMANTPSADEVIGWDHINSVMIWEDVGTLSLTDDSVTEPKLQVSNTAGAGQYLEWDGTALTWSTVGGGLASVATDTTLTGTGSAATPLGIIDGGVSTLQVADDAITGDKIADTAVNTDQVADSAITEPKLSIHNQPLDGYYLEFDAVYGMQWVADPSTGGLSAVSTDSTIDGTGVSGSPLSLADDAVTTAKIATDAVHSSEIIAGAVGTSEIADDGVGTVDIADGAVTEAKLAIHNAPQGGYYLEFDATDGMQWVVTPSNTGLTAVTTDASITGTGVTGSPLSIAAGSITTARVVDDAITGDKIADAAVNTAQVVDASITEGKLSIANAPSIGYYLEWNGTTMEWVADPSTGGLTAVATDGTIDGTGITASPLSIADDAITSARIDDGAVETADIDAGAVTEPKLSIHNAPVDGYYLEWHGTNGMQWVADPSSGGLSAVSTDSTLTGTGVSGSLLGIADDGVTTAKVADDAITGAKLANNSVNSDQIASGAVGSSEISSGAVGNSELANNAVTGAKIASSAVGASELGSDAVETDKIQDDAVTSAKIANNAVGSSELASDSVTNGKIATGAVDTGELAGDAVTSAKIEANAVGSSELAANSVTGGKIASGAVGSTDLAANAVTSGKIADGEVSSDDIASNAINSGKIQDGTVSTDDLANNAVTGAKIANGTVGRVDIADNAIGTDQVGDEQITVNKLDISNSETTNHYLQWSGTELQWSAVSTGTGGITAVDSDSSLKGDGTSSDLLGIADNGVGSTQISDDAVGTSEIANDAVTSSEIVDEGVEVDDLDINNLEVDQYFLQWETGTGMQWAAANTGSVVIADGSITTAKLADGAVTTVKVNDDAITGDKIADATIPEAALLIDNTPANDEVLSWNGTTMEWVAQTTGTGGLTTVSTNATISGDGTGGSPLSVADDGITSDKIAAGAVDSADLASDAVTNSKVADDAIGTDQVANNAITGDKILDLTVDTDDIATDAVTGAKIANDAVGVDALSIFGSEVDGRYLQWDSGNGMQWSAVSTGTGGLTEVHSDSTLSGDGTSADELGLADDGVTTVKVLDGAITGAKIFDGTVNTVDLASGSVSTVKLANDAVAEDKIADNAVRAIHIADESVTEPKLEAFNDPTDEYFLQWDATDGMQWAEVASGTLADGSVTTAKLANGAVTDAKIANGTITEGKLNIGNAPSDGYVLTWDSSGSGALEWTAKAASGSGTSVLTGTAFHAGANDGNLFLFNADTANIGSDAVSYDGSTAVTSAQRGDLFKYDITDTEWVLQTSVGDYLDDAPLTGNPTAPTATAGDDDTSVATTAFVAASHNAESKSLGAVDQLPQASADCSGQTAILRASRIEYVCTLNPHPIDSLVGDWTSIGSITGADPYIVQDRTDRTPVFDESIYERATGLFFTGTDIDQSQTVDIQWVQDDPDDVLAENLTTVSDVVHWLGPWLSDEEATEAVATINADASLDANTEYFYFESDEEDIRRLDNSSYATPGTVVGHYEWWPTKADPTDPQIVRVSNGILPRISPLGHDDAREVITNNGIYFVDIIYHAQTAATGTWALYTETQYLGAFAHAPKPVPDVGETYFDFGHRAWRIGKAHTAGSFTPNRWVDWKGPSGYYGAFDNRDLAIASPRAGNGKIAFTGARVETISGYTAAEDAFTARQWLLTSQISGLREVLYADTANQVLVNSAYRAITLSRALGAPDRNDALVLRIEYGEADNRRVLEEEIGQVGDYLDLTTKASTVTSTDNTISMVIADGTIGDLTTATTQAILMFIARGTGTNQLLIGSASLADYFSARISIILE